MRAHNSTFDRTAGSRSLAAAGQRERWADQRLLPCLQDEERTMVHGRGKRTCGR